MKFNRTEAEKELSTLLSRTEIHISELEYPQLVKMARRGSKATLEEYFKSVFGDSDD